MRRAQDDDNDDRNDRIKKFLFRIQDIMKRGHSLEKMNDKFYTNLIPPHIIEIQRN